MDETANIKNPKVAEPEPLDTDGAGAPHKISGETPEFEALCDMTVGYTFALLAGIILLGHIELLLRPYLFILSGAQVMCPENLFHNYIHDPMQILYLLLALTLLAGGTAAHFSRRFGYTMIKAVMAVYAVIYIPMILPIFSPENLKNVEGEKGLFFSPSHKIFIACLIVLITLTAYVTLRGTRREVFNLSFIFSLLLTYIWYIRASDCFVYPWYPFDTVFQHSHFMIHVPLLYILGRTVRQHFIARSSRSRL